MRKSEREDLKALHNLVVHSDHKTTFDAVYGHLRDFNFDITPYELREQKLVQKAGEYELAEICSECFQIKSRREIGFKPDSSL